MIKVNKMKEANINQIARIAGCSTPEGNDTDGAKFLRDCYNEAQDMKSVMRGGPGRGRGRTLDDNSINDIADGLVPGHTNELWNVWVDCGGYEFDGDYRDFSSSNDTGDRMNRIAQADCFEWAHNIISTVAREGMDYSREDY
jgi:hypothetical protein